MMWERAQARFLLRWRFVLEGSGLCHREKGRCPCSSEGEQAEICHRQSGDRAWYCTGSDGGTTCSDTCLYRRVFRKHERDHPASSGQKSKSTDRDQLHHSGDGDGSMNAIRDFSLTDVDIVQLSAARSKSIGRYHMMMGENPIYIISCSGRGEEI